MAELATKVPLFPGECEIHQLFLIFKVLGTPTEAMWRGVTALSDFNAAFPQWPARSLADVLPALDPLGADLLAGLLKYQPEERLTAQAAMQHPWFDDIRDSVSPVPGPAEGI